MPRFFVKTNQVKDNKIYIQGEDIKHIKNVLRKEIGNEIEICNSENKKAYICRITNFNINDIECEIIKTLNEQENKLNIDIYQGIPKLDKMELIIQKSVELGANAIIPLKLKRCIAKIDSSNENKKIERWQKIAESAAKQCGSNEIPKIKNVHTIYDIINMEKQYDAILVAYECEKQNKIKNILLRLKEKIYQKEKINIGIIIGPEGGLDPTEVDILKNNGAFIVSLGNRILRTETVALNMLSIIRYEFEN